MLGKVEVSLNCGDADLEFLVGYPDLPGGEEPKQLQLEQ
jgi:hypothetical protein